MKEMIDTAVLIVRKILLKNISGNPNRISVTRGMYGIQPLVCRRLTD